MSIRVVSCLSAWLLIVPSGLGQGPDQIPKQSSGGQIISVEPTRDSLSMVLLRIQSELKQIATEIQSIDALQQTKVSGDPGSSAAPRIHTLLQNDHPASLIRDFMDSHHDRSRWESCLKSGRLYRSLATEAFSIPKVAPGTSQPVPGGERTQIAQLFLLSRMISELELQSGALQAEPKASPNTEPADLWHSLRKAMRQDDQVLLGKLNALLAATGESPKEFSARVLSQSDKGSPTTASIIAESLTVLSGAGDPWQLASVPGIDPDFLKGLECEKGIMESAAPADFSAAILRAFDCRRSTDGSYLEAFGTSRNRVESNETGLRARLPGGDDTQSRDIFRLPTERELRELQTQDLPADPAPTTPGQPPTFGVSNTPVKRPKIPSWWIRCACPADHPDAGIVFEGVRWHAPVLQCPNPELRRLEVK